MSGSVPYSLLSHSQSAAYFGYSVQQIVTSFGREQEEETRGAAASSQAKPGQWMNWHSVETGKITYNVLPTPQNLSQ